MLCSFYTNARVSSKGKNSSTADVNFSCDSLREKILSQICNQISVIITDAYIILNDYKFL